MDSKHQGHHHCRRRIVSNAFHVFAALDLVIRVKVNDNPAVEVVGERSDMAKQP
jgi:hypothetical protein